MANPYIINIMLPTDSEGAMAGGSAAQSESTSEGGQNAKTAVDAVQKVVSYAAVMHTADKLISYNISQVNLKTGAGEYQQRLETVYSGLKQVYQAGAAVVGGILTGNPLVAVTGLAWMGVNQAVSLAQKADELNTQRDLENVSIGMQIVRAGAAGRRGN